MKVAYAQNLLSTVNVVLKTMRKDTALSVSPFRTVGSRSNVRKTSPASFKISESTVQTSVTSVLNRVASVQNSQLSVPMGILTTRNKLHLHSVSALCRVFGLRFKEASLLNIGCALRQANTHSKINVTTGTKGGRGKRVDRWIPVSVQGLSILKEALKVQGPHQNLIPEQHNYKQWRDHAYSQWRRATKTTDIRGFHDLRAAYACERYEQITGSPAPVINGFRAASKELDLQARLIIALELGHSRDNILVSYIGSSK